MAVKQRGILITNLGSPKEPTVSAVRDYLREFLMDPWVFALPKPLRFLIVQLILRSRPEKSAEAYASIWTNQGSPLLVHANQLADQVRQKTGLPVAVGMRYGQPSFEDAQQQLQDCEEVVLVSPYPQYAESTVRSMVEHAQTIFAGKSLLMHAPFFDDPEFIAAQVQEIHANLPAATEHVVLSFHGIPNQHLRNADPTNRHCLRVDSCCSLPSEAHATCYRHQCLETANLIGAQLSLPWSWSFQSRLGRGAWLQPYTIEHVRSLAESGIKHLAVACPAFISDNLETLFEISVEVSEAFSESGGESLKLIPNLNNSPLWVDRVVRWGLSDSSTLLPIST